MSPLSNKEKQRRYKERLKKDPLKYEEYKKKKRENYHAKKRLVQDLTPKEKYNARVIWRLRKQEQRNKARNVNRILENTPPSSPTIFDVGANIPWQPNMNVNHFISPCVSPVSVKRTDKLKKDRSKLQKEKLKLLEQNEKLKQKVEKYKKKHQRTVKKLRQIEQKQAKAKTPMSPQEKYNILSNSIKERYKTLKTRRDKRLLKSVFYKINDSSRIEITKDTLGITRKLQQQPLCQTKGNKITTLKKVLHDFYNRDDISRATAGRKETKTINKVKIQKRFLLDSMKNLYRTFKAENPSLKCSYSYFTRNRPPYVKPPTVEGREMCLCKPHINPMYKASQLKKKHLINSSDLSTLMTSLVCNPNRQSCMYGTCNVCCNKEILYDTNRDIETISWTEWGRREEIYEKEGKKLKAVKNVKENKDGTVKDLMTLFNKEIKVLKKHVFNMKTQYRCFRQAIDNLEKTEIVLVADFSENYNGKYYEEVQAHHFGGSREQISLHTVVVYILGEDGKLQIKSFCTISSCTNHQPPAIWAHLEPVLNEIRNEYPHVQTIHFFTDGPFSQYRQKQNFYLCSTKTFDKGFSSVTWSYFEAGHGKGTVFSYFLF